MIWREGWFGAVVEGAKSFLRAFFVGLEGKAGWRRKRRALKIQSGEPAGLCERMKRDFSTAQTDTFAGAKVEEKASVRFGRNDKVWESAYFGRNDKFVELLTAGQH